MLKEKLLSIPRLNKQLAQISQAFSNYKPRVKYQELYNEIVKETSNLPNCADIPERVYCILNDIKERPICMYCKEEKVVFYTYVYGYKNTCSISCRDKFNGLKSREREYKPCSDKQKEKIRQSHLNRSSKEIKKSTEKRQKTNIKKYGSKWAGDSKQHAEIVSKRWDNTRKMLNKINKLYTRDEINKLLNSDNLHYTNYFGKAKNRTMILEDPKLYKSIMKETEFILDEKYISKTRFNFTCRILIAGKYNFDILKILCKCREKITYDPATISFSQQYCKKCMPSVHSKEYFRDKYGLEWETYYIEDIQKLNIHLNKQDVGYSKISQELIWGIFQKLTIQQKLDSEFATYLGEKIINLEKEDKVFILEKTGIARNSFYLDFICGNKIIEYNGEYWHSKTQKYDKYRKEILEKMGYEVLFIEEKDYKQGKKETINKCINFINT